MPSCELCLVELSTKQVLERHMISHSGYRPFPCHLCEKRFMRKDSLNTHLLVHQGLKPHKCGYCDFAAADPRNITRHTRRVHFKESGEVEVYQCTVCGKTFSKQSRFNGHLKFHSGDGLLQCEICEKVFTMKEDLNRHMKVHTRAEGDRWPCDACGRTFAWRKGLYRHEANNCRGEPDIDDLSKIGNTELDGGREIRSKRKHYRRRKNGDKGKLDVGSESGVTPAPGRGILTCRLCQGEFLSLPDMYTHECSGK